MRVDILTASSINGIITPGRGVCSHDLVPVLNPPRELWEAKYEVRRRHDAVLVGSNTVLSNDPTMSSHAAPGYEVVRATIDSAGRIPPGFRFFDGSVRTLVGVTDSTPDFYRRLLEERGVEAVPCGSGRPELSLFLAGLEERGVRTAVCEGGGILNRALLDQGFLGRIYLLLLEVILDAGSVNLFEGPGAPVPLRLEALERIGESVLLTYAKSTSSG